MKAVHSVTNATVWTVWSLCLQSLFVSPRAFMPFSRTGSNMAVANSSACWSCLISFQGTAWPIRTACSLQQSTPITTREQKTVRLCFTELGGTIRVMNPTSTAFISVVLIRHSLMELNGTFGMAITTPWKLRKWKLQPINKIDRPTVNSILEQDPDLLTMRTNIITKEPIPVITNMPVLKSENNTLPSRQVCRMR